MEDPFYGNISEITEKNNYYRQVLYTTPYMQLVIMSLEVRSEIPEETHPYVTQFIRIEKGNGVAKVDGKIYHLDPDFVIIIPPGSVHTIMNTSYTEDLKFYTIYSPPNHPFYRIDYKSDE